MTVVDNLGLPGTGRRDGPVGFTEPKKPPTGFLNAVAAYREKNPHPPHVQARIDEAKAEEERRIAEGLKPRKRRRATMVYDEKRILYLHRRGWTNREIGEDQNIHRITVGRVLARLREKGELE